MNDILTTKQSTKLFGIDIDFADIAAIGTWLLVFALTIYFMNGREVYQPDIPIVAGLFVVYLACFMGIVHTPDDYLSITQKLMLLVTMLASAYGILWFVPAGYLSILTIIWVAVLIHFVSIKVCIAITVLVIASWFTFFSWKWQFENMVFTAALYGTFHMFAIFMAHQTQQAELAQERLQQLNRELRATQDLVEQASRQQERTRIARDLHDLIGHHLTALIINLEVAKHQSTGPAREQVEQSHALAKLLLSDVREAIHEIRAHDSIDIKSLIELWRSYIPNMTINTTIDETISWHDLTVTQTLSFCILEALTNCMRHAKATEITIEIKQSENRLLTHISDNGQVKEQPIPGNGLIGMQERLTRIGGALQTEVLEGHLELFLDLPMKVQHSD